MGFYTDRGSARLIFYRDEQDKRDGQDIFDLTLWDEDAQADSGGNG